MPNANKDSALHAAAMEEKWGALLGTSSNAAAATVEDESQGKAVLTLNSGIVSAAYLDMNVRDVMYEISPLNEKGEISSPGASCQFGK
jgi:methanogenic corrinoid protein MtbC1